MNQTELILQGYKLEMATLTQEIQSLRADIEKKSRIDSLPEWVTLEMAVSLKGGPALATYRTKFFLQPCCGRNSKLIGGRKCWSRKDVIDWLSITDAELKNYAHAWNVTIPANYERRSA
jgi:hypothetical protein